MSETNPLRSPVAAFVEFPHLEDAGEALARDAAGWLKSAQSKKGDVFIAVPGGTSPAPFFQALAQADLDWGSVHVTLTDERFVPGDSDESNAKLLRRTFLHGDAARAHFAMPDLSNVTLAQAADAWDRQLRTAPDFDLVVLGMGDDGHFASLFPGGVALAAGLDLDADRYALAVPDRTPQRLSLTLRALLRTRRLAFLIGGAAKRAVVEAAWRGEPYAAGLPISSLIRQSPIEPSFYWGAAT